MGKGKICRRVIAPGMLPGDSTRSVARGDFMAIYERVISLKSSNRGVFDRIYVSNIIITLLLYYWLVPGVLLGILFVLKDTSFF